MTKMRPTRWVVVTALIAACFAALWLARLPLLRLAGRWLDIGTRPTRADYVLVLPGDWNGRPFVAAALVKAGLARAALVPQVKRSPSVLEGIDLPNDEVIRRVLLARGVPEERIIVLPGQSTSTWAETHMLRKFLASRPEASIAIVTSHYHTRRTRMLLACVLGRDLMRRITLVSAPTDDFQLDSWWKTEEGFVRITEEYVKLACYWMRYGNGLFWMAALAAVGATAVVARWVRRRSRHRKQLAMVGSGERS